MAAEKNINTALTATQPETPPGYSTCPSDLSAGTQAAPERAEPLPEELQTFAQEPQILEKPPQLPAEERPDARQWKFLLTFYDKLRPLQDPEAILADAARLSGEFFQAVRCAYGLVDSLQSTLTIDQHYTEDAITWSGVYRLEDWDKDVLQELRNGRTLQLDNGERDGRLQQIAGAFPAAGDLHSLLLQMMFDKAQNPVMLFAIGHRQPRIWLAQELELISQLLERTWLVLAQTRAEYALSDSIRQLEQQQQQLAENGRHKNKFLSILGHELRNPLAAVHNTLKVLELQAEQSDQSSPVPAVLERQMQHMQRLIDGLLDISRINTGKIELERQPVMVTDCIATAVETLQPVIDVSGHQLSISLPQQTLWLDGDPVRLAQILENLLVNAVKYSLPGSRIRLTAKHCSPNVTISVRDNGIGIFGEDLQHVFDIYAHPRNVIRHVRSGLGLGLTLVKELVELHDGKVEAFSQGSGCGSEFVVTLPLANPPPAAADTGRNPASVRPAAVLPRRIVIIDDSADNADSLAALLTALGHQVRAIYSGTAALATVHRFEPEYVFVDISMPDIDGFEVARQLRREYAAGTLMLIALSGYGSDEDIRTAIAAGFDHYLLKPVRLEQIHTLLATAI